MTIAQGDLHTPVAKGEVCYLHVARKDLEEVFRWPDEMICCVVVVLHLQSVL